MMNIALVDRDTHLGCEADDEAQNHGFDMQVMRSCYQRQSEFYITLKRFPLQKIEGN